MWGPFSQIRLLFNRIKNTLFLLPLFSCLLSELDRTSGSLKKEGEMGTVVLSSLYRRLCVVVVVVCVFVCVFVCV